MCGSFWSADPRAAHLRGGILRDAARILQVLIEASHGGEFPSDGGGRTSGAQIGHLKAEVSSGGGAEVEAVLAEPTNEGPQIHEIPAASVL